MMRNPLEPHLSLHGNLTGVLPQSEHAVLRHKRFCKNQKTARIPHNIHIPPKILAYSKKMAPLILNYAFAVFQKPRQTAVTRLFRLPPQIHRQTTQKN